MWRPLGALSTWNWNFGGINIGKGELVARVNRNGVYADKCGFDDYTPRIVFKSYDLVENYDGSRVYTPNPIGNARVAIIHYAETVKERIGNHTTWPKAYQTPM